MTCRFTIYCHTDKVNGKRYIGQTFSTMEERWTEHIRAARRNVGCRLLSAAIRDHGHEAFSHEILEIVETQEAADEAEIRWIGKLQSKSPHGYNLTIGGSGLDKVRAGQKDFWAQFNSEEKSKRVRHQLAGMSQEEKSARVRKSWAGMTPEAREARVSKAISKSTATKSLPAHSKKMSEWQTAQAKLRTPEQRRAMVLKAWETRRAKYGKDGVKRVKTSEEYGASTARGWANMTPEARTERV